MTTETLVLYFLRTLGWLAFGAGCLVISVGIVLMLIAEPGLVICLGLLCVAVAWTLLERK